MKNNMRLNIWLLSSVSYSEKKRSKKIFKVQRKVSLNSLSNSWFMHLQSVCLFDFERDYTIIAEYLLHKIVALINFFIFFFSKNLLGQVLLKSTYCGDGTSTTMFTYIYWKVHVHTKILYMLLVKIIHQGLVGLVYLQ